jgi:Golgi nucleoside diphosphatase
VIQVRIVLVGVSPATFGISCFDCCRASNAAVANAIITSIRRTIATYSFNLDNLNNMVRIIDGTEEGTFAWIAANYLMGTFTVRIDPVHSRLSLSIWLLIS